MTSRGLVCGGHREKYSKGKRYSLEQRQKVVTLKMRECLMEVRAPKGVSASTLYRWMVLELQSTPLSTRRHECLVEIGAPKGVPPGTHYRWTVLELQHC